MRRSSQIALVAALVIGSAALGLLLRQAQKPQEPAPAVSEAPSASGANTTADLDGAKFVRWAQPRELPHLAFNDEKGRLVSLKDFHGRMVLLNLWATWCPPCREEMPSLDRLNAKRRSATFEVVALSLDSPEKSQAFLRAIQAQTLRGYTDHQGGALRTLGLVSVPTTLLIDAKGREIGRTVGPAAWDGPAALNLIDSITKEPT
ncbi:TlpA disulfide reductase family protein [Pseudorhodoferax sp. LjRoot39]|uniref:TlpA family protein disulfide reductase n=1 Tax=Pseudorhodoferax sp. LjRoot39 TaxID=3342328 RepID=UPI003ECCCDBA